MMTERPSICEVVITAPDGQWLLGFTRKLIEERLAACGHHFPLRSVYTWDGTVQEEHEARVALHTRAEHVPAIIAATLAEHPYDVPCVISTPITHASDDYAAWIITATERSA